MTDEEKAQEQLPEEAAKETSYAAPMRATHTISGTLIAVEHTFDDPHGPYHPKTVATLDIRDRITPQMIKVTDYYSPEGFFTRHPIGSKVEIEFSIWRRPEKLSETDAWDRLVLSKREEEPRHHAAE